MRRLWDVLGTFLITALAVFLLFSMIRPYAIFLVIGLVVYAIGFGAYRHARRW